MSKKELSIYFVLISFFCVIFPSIFSQTTISGSIKDEKGIAFPFTNVIICPPDNPNMAIAFCLSDNDGNYSLKFNSDSDSLLIRLTSMTIEPQSKVIKNISSIHNFTVKEQMQKITEVVVKAQKIYSEGDTINYHVDSFAQETDISIGEVLKRMPGISVKPDGRIEYQGRPIKSLTIEGLDLMKGRYGLATNNISPRDISTVQILENHQDIEALKGLRFEDRATINLKLRQGAKGVFKLIGAAGIGYDDNILWDNELTGMYFARTKQHFSTYKGNNRGTDLAREMHSFSDVNYGSTFQMTSIQLPMPPGIDKNKYYFNNSNSGSLNNIFKQKNKDEIGINFIYLNDYERRNSAAKTTYLLPDGTVNIIDETLSSGMNTNQLSGEISYKKNEKKNYIFNQFSFSGIWDKGTGIVNIQDTIHQNMDIYTVKISNRLHFIRRIDESKGFELFSTANVEEKPQNLYVFPFLFENLSSDNQESIHQYSKTKNISTRNQITLLSALVLGDVKINPGTFLNFSQDGLESKFSTLPNNSLSNNIFSNDTHYRRLETGVNISINYFPGRLRFFLYFPLYYRHLNLLQVKQQKEFSRDKIIFTPNLTVDYVLSSSSRFSTSYAMSYNTPSIINLYSGYILNSYRTISIYEVNLHESLMQNAYLGYNYRNIIKMLFGGFSVSYSRYNPKVLYGNKFDGIFSEIITHKVNTYGEQISVNLRTSKGFYWKNLKIGMEATCSLGDNPLLIQDEVIRFQSESIILVGDFSLRPFSFMGLGYEGRFGEIGSRQKDRNKLPAIRTLTNNCNANFNLLFNMVLSAKIHNYYNSQAFNNKSFTLTDLELIYTRRQTRFSLEWGNIFNVQNYNYSYITSLTSYYSEYTIRPMSVIFKARFKIL